MMTGNLKVTRKSLVKNCGYQKRRAMAISFTVQIKIQSL